MTRIIRTIDKRKRLLKRLKRTTCACGTDERTSNCTFRISMHTVKEFVLLLALYPREPSAENYSGGVKETIITTSPRNTMSLEL